MTEGSAINETGLLVRHDAGFCLQRDAGGRYLLDLARMPVDEIEKRVRVIGVVKADGRVEVEGIGLVRE